MINVNLPLFECIFATNDALYQAYMPFLHGGGLFIKTNPHHALGDLILLKIILPDDATVYQVMGKIAWITPKGAQGNKPAGVGVQFIDDVNFVFCSKIKKILGELLKSSQTTDTM